MEEEEDGWMDCSETAPPVECVVRAPSKLNAPFNITRIRSNKTLGGGEGGGGEGGGGEGGGGEGGSLLGING